MAVINPECPGGCCPGRECDGGMVRTAIFDEDTNRWVPVDYICRTCNGDNHTRECIEECEAAWDRFYSDDAPR